jgi:outer membrane receptor for ferrienterochelin and colicin
MRAYLFILVIIVLNISTLTAQVTEIEDNRKQTVKLSSSDLMLSKDTTEMSVISASRSSKKIGDLPITIYVITREDILKNHYTSLIDAIKSLPGVRVSQPGTGELGESFQLRGLIGNLYTMILINGLPIKPEAVIGMPILSQLPIGQAERIEVIYGPSAAVYGADAVSGVINIITKEADKGTFVMGDISLGLDEYKNSNFMVGGKTGKNKNIMQYNFYGGLSEINDLNIKNGYEAAYYNGTPTLPEIEDLPASSNMLGFQLRYRDISLSFNNMYRRSHSSLGQSPYFFKYNNPQNFWGENIRSTSLSYNHEWSPWLYSTTNFSSLVYRMDNNSNMGITFIDYTDKVYRYAASNDLLLEQLFTILPVNGLEIISGITYKLSGVLPQTNFLDAPFKTSLYKPFSTSVDFTDPVSGNFGINPEKYHNTSFFSQAYYSVNSFRLMGGIRIDNNSHYGLSVSPRIAGLYILNPRTSFRGSLGFAYKAPPSSLSWQSLAYKTGTNYDSLKYISIPNPLLEPENYRSVELGLIKTYKRGLNINISVYYNEIRNRIMDINIPTANLGLPLAIVESASDSATVLTRINSQKSISRLYGLQANLKMNDIVKSIHMNGELSLTFAKSSEQFPELLQLAGNYISNFKLIPNHYGQLRLSMQPVKNLYLQVTSIWESSWLRIIIPFKELYNDIIRDKDGFYSMDIVANYKIGSNLSSYFKVSNIFDERYGGPGYSGMNTPLPYDPQIGRSFRIGLTYTLN